MITVRKAEERGHAEHGWLESWHTFSFANYHDPQHMGFRSLRVVNEDRIEPSRGFGAHSHRDMEILTYILSGALEHKDSLGNGSVIRPGDVQRMTAGTGVTHSEYNHSAHEPVHLLQIWVLPDTANLPPSYEEKHFSEADRRGVLRLVASADARQGSVEIHQDADLYAAVLRPAESVHLDLRSGRAAWIQVARGQITVDGNDARQGDGIAIERRERVTIAAIEPSEFLLFDLA